MSVLLLLDTHALLWSMFEPEKLSPVAREHITSRANTLLVSAASSWEIATKHRIGKLPGVEALLSTFSTQVARLGADELSITSQHAILAGTLEWDHRDPFDRMLVAQSMIEGAALITADGAFDGYAGATLLW